MEINSSRTALRNHLQEVEFTSAYGEHVNPPASVPFGIMLHDGKEKAVHPDACDTCLQIACLVTFKAPKSRLAKERIEELSLQIARACEAQNKAPKRGRFKYRGPLIEAYRASEHGAYKDFGGQAPGLRAAE